MRPISPTMHGVLDYTVGLANLSLPWLLGFSNNRRATQILAGAEAGTLVLSAFTDYEPGVIRRVPMRAHLSADVVTGVLLLASPWLFGFSDRVKWPHVVAGAGSITAAMLTRPASRPVSSTYSTG